MVHLFPLTAVTYYWNTGRCYSNLYYTYGYPGCFPNGQTTQNVTDNLTAEDSGTITCSVTVDGLTYTSNPMTIRVLGESGALC